jgi:hypothetical protein
MPSYNAARNTAGRLMVYGARKQCYHGEPHTVAHQYFNKPTGWRFDSSGGAFMADPAKAPQQSSASDTSQKLYYDSAACQSAGQETPAQEAAQPSEQQRPKAPAKKNVALKILVWFVVIVTILALALVISSIIAGFDTVFDMIEWILDPANTGNPFG